MDARTEVKTATLGIGNQSWSFPIYPGTIGPDVIDISTVSYTHLTLPTILLV